MKKYLYLTIVILFMAVIFYLSSQPATESNQLSRGLTAFIVEQIDEVAPNVNLTNHNVRKYAHFLLYLVLGLIVTIILGRFKIQGFWRSGVALIICVLYATSDEIHQIFVPGRGAQVEDVLIDSTGASIGIGIYWLVSIVIKQRKNHDINQDI